MPLPKLTFVIGAAASGKSAYAEALVRASGLARTYIATAEAFDDEMAAKIAAHRAARAAHGWQTQEAPLDVTGALARTGPGQAVLLDCLTLWLSNLMLAERDALAEVDLMLDRVAGLATPVVIVSNEVGAGVVPDTSLGRAFRGVQGRANQAVAARADCVVQVTVGLPQALKGPLPGLAQ